ncbi:8-oxo-dGTP pyrophosphatase MutT, NUDIX family [Salegentibacter holothuriorum]|uniref:8-oxo-dGTP pyrophosphatase MutT, NUDIX family n=1 Tax=Salegentibacter holothuriorum TaxID=241145 RepID=A0A1T5ECU3_9FLAO|nr:CoA pyrophosphatase [Salegentibacter holothuriorum]SKB81754.1 8-oxo-dGTP pyrophosphatase MutT, NUDIX family [Salegentibacter holothuriorum]
MDFQDFKDRIPKLKKIVLPGEEAHHKLVPGNRREEMRNLDINSLKPNKAGVMAVFYPNNSGKTHLVLILRKTYKGVHSNQIGFPGGRVEPDDVNLEQTALRETEEEVGIPRNNIEVIRELTRLYIPPSNFWVQPYLGLLDETPTLIPQESEVERILEVDLDHFLDHSNFVNQELSTSYSNKMVVPAFKLNEQIVWGATGMMLSEIREIFRKSF